jgi:Rrf2 family protein
LIYSKTSEYGIRALSLIALKPKGVRVSIEEVSRRSKVPQAYVAKIFQVLAQAKILRSYRGPGGGYCLVKDPTTLTLSKVICALDDSTKSIFSNCIMGLNKCEDGNPCPLHPIWSETKKKIQHQLDQSTVCDISKLADRFKNGKTSRSTLSAQFRKVFGQTKKI